VSTSGCRQGVSLGLSLRVSQQLSLTPQLQQSIRLLQLSTVELTQEIEQMLGDNPFLELEHDEIQQEEFGIAQADIPANGNDDTTATQTSESDLIAEATPDWEGDGTMEITPDDGEWGGEAPARNGVDENETSAADLAQQHESLTDHLHRQALELRLSDIDTAALRFLIESLNDDGYLDESLESLAQSLAGADDPKRIKELLHHFTVARSLLQNLDPPGVGARNLAECLALQLRAMQQSNEGNPVVIEVALAICNQPLELLARRDTRRLVQITGSSEDTVGAAMSLIALLEPRPSRRFTDVKHNVIVPDVIVKPAERRAGRRFSVQINPDILPRLRVHEAYANALRNNHNNENQQALQQHLQEARWFVKNIQQRFDTILRVSRAIVERQTSFLVHGALAMRPLVRGDIARALKMHDSTISRVTTAKYMATPQGTYELKYFFGPALDTETGGNASSTAVRALIKQFVSAENPQKPLSDGKIADLLQEQGIECARRTVAKYRETLKIPAASLRKVR